MAQHLESLILSIQEGTATGTNRNHSICDFSTPSPLLDVAQLYLIVVLAPAHGARRVSRPCVDFAVGDSAAFKVDC